MYSKVDFYSFPFFKLVHFMSLLSAARPSLRCSERPCHVKADSWDVLSVLWGQETLRPCFFLHIDHNRKQSDVTNETSICLWQHAQHPQSEAAESVHVILHVNRVWVQKFNSSIIYVQWHNLYLTAASREICVLRGVGQRLESILNEAWLTAINNRSL